MNAQLIREHSRPRQSLALLEPSLADGFLDGLRHPTKEGDPFVGVKGQDEIAEAHGNEIRYCKKLCFHFDHDFNLRYPTRFLRDPHASGFRRDGRGL